METKTTIETIEFNGWTLRVHPAETKTPRLLIMIHGLTGDENSMWVFARKFSSDYWIVAPRAPYSAKPQGFSWRANPLTVEQVQNNQMNRPSLEMILPSAEALIKLIGEYSASVRVEAGQFDAIGFSQGAAMVNVLGMLYPDRIRKMGVLAGFVPSGMDAYVNNKVLAGKHIFVAHGTQDDMVPIDRARASIQLLERAGASITYCEDEVGHKLSSNCLKALEEYLSSP